MFAIHESSTTRKMLIKTNEKSHVSENCVFLHYFYGSKTSIIAMSDRDFQVSVAETFELIATRHRQHSKHASERIHLKHHHRYVHFSTRKKVNESLSAAVIESHKHDDHHHRL